MPSGWGGLAAARGGALARLLGGCARFFAALAGLLQAELDVLQESVGGIGGASHGVDLELEGLAHGLAYVVREDAALGPAHVFGRLLVGQGLDALDLAIAYGDVQWRWALVAHHFLGDVAGVDNFALSRGWHGCPQGGGHQGNR